MAVVTLNNTPANYDDGLDSIVITDYLQGKRGGTTLDMTGFASDAIVRAGHVIIQSTAAGAKQYRPMPVTGTNSISALGVITPGSAYTPTSQTASVTYAAVALTGGTGTGATADITVTNGMVTAVVLVAKGSGYAASDNLSAAAANIGGTGTGFSVTVRSINPAAAYGTLTTGYAYYGVCVNSVLASKPFAGIMVRGNFNPVAAPYDFETIRAAFTTATGGRITAIAD